MAKLIVTVFLLFLLNHGTETATAGSGKDFSHNCPPSRCSDGGPEIRFPFRLNSNPASCGAPGMQLSCSGHETVLEHPTLGPCNVTTIDYKLGAIDVVLGDSWSRCPIQRLISTNLSTQVYQPYDPFLLCLVACSEKFAPRSGDGIVGPISCPSFASQFMYVVNAYQSMDVLPMDCMVVSNGIPMPYSIKTGPSDFSATVNDFLARPEVSFTWSAPENIASICKDCEASRRRCGFRSETRQAFCIHRGSTVKTIVISVTSVTAFIILSLMVLVSLYISLKSRNDQEIYLKVEMFLETYSTTTPTRYTFSQVKKITKQFKDKLGQGGFGSVYKGELADRIPVAVKMLENSKGEGEEFINEVATVGRIHHANVVRLLGFCSEGTRRALVYEFMPNDSLEKYIFSRDSDAYQEILRTDKLLDIALGIARGIEYLHQGCNQRILHFDIKPHNILLDYNFNPKISDFGLAKLCLRDQSIITLTAARGTMGYIAPELYSRNFGTISYKSDVYSFGMLVLEMVSGRRNSEPGIENQDEVYFPEWIYEQLVTGQNIGLGREMTHQERTIIRKLTMVALWCIQWNPIDRPSMTKVVHMLMGSLESLRMPPKPFVSSLGSIDNTVANEV